MAGKKQDSLKLDKVPAWISQDNIDKLKSADFQRIVRFFVINTPDKKTCARGKEISEYGIADEAALFEELIGDIPHVTGKQTIEISELTQAGLIDFPPQIIDERVCFAVSNDKPVTSLFIKIRDSLAHGRFNFGMQGRSPVLIMEDINSRENCSARMILKFATLKRWIERLED